MSHTLRRWYLPLAAATLLTSTAIAATPAAAGGVIDPVPIGPGQYFTGLVNGSSGPAAIRMACFGPVFPGETGHPLAGQTVAVQPAPASKATGTGFTGTAATAVVVDFGEPASTTAPVILRAYRVTAAIPTTLTLPCFGTGTVTFTPVPGSPTAVPATVPVDFVGQP